jgi:4-hydroxy-2-oxoheptanedioate aldolase
MEHNPMRFDQMEYFLAGLIDKAAILKTGNVQARPAVFARFVPYGREEALWVVKHALDIGLMGILVNNLETKEQAENVVRTMRYVQRRDTKIPNPPGLRGSGSGLAAWFWGVTPSEYIRRADLYPNNPEGDLLFWPMIETKLGVQNADEIAQVPGVGGFYLGSGSDLSASMGLESADHPEAQAAFLDILRVCKARNIPCGGSVDAGDVARRIKDGYKIINFGGANGGLTAGNAAARVAALAAGAVR